MEEKECYESLLNVDCLLNIFFFLEFKDYQNVVLVNKKWNDIITNETQSMFKEKCKKLFEFRLPLPKKNDWKNIYRSIYMKDIPVIEKYQSDKFWPDIEKHVQKICYVSVLRVEFVYQKAIEKFPNCSPLLGNYANTLFNLSDQNDATEKLYKEAMKVDPKNLWPVFNYARFLVNIFHFFNFKSIYKIGNKERKL